MRSAESQRGGEQDQDVGNVRPSPELELRMRNRLMLSRISSAVLVHMKSLELRLLATR